MYFGSFFNALNTGTSSYFKMGTIGAKAGWIFTNLQATDRRPSCVVALFQLTFFEKQNSEKVNFELTHGLHLKSRSNSWIRKLYTCSKDPSKSNAKLREIR